MESVYNFSESEIIGFTLVLIRVSMLIVTMPVIGGGTVPPQLKMLFSLGICFILFPTVGGKDLAVGISEVAIVNIAAKEAVIGIVMGYLARFFFMALTMTGQIMSVSMGISSIQLYNPLMNESSGAFDQFFIILGTLFFLAINGHHIFIGGLADSYQIVPLVKESISFAGFGQFGVLAHEVMTLAVKLSAPILVTILFSNVAMAVVGRAVPQINILITSLPVNTLLGLAVVVAFLPVFIVELSSLMNITADRVFQMLKTF